MCAKVLSVLASVLTTKAKEVDVILLLVILTVMSFPSLCRRESANIDVINQCLSCR